MNAAAHDIQDYLHNDQILELMTGVDLFTDSEPVSPDNIVTLYDTPDAGPQLFLNKEDDDEPDDRYEYVGVQTRIRNNHANAGKLLAGEIMGVLHGKGNMVINDTLYTLIQALDSPTVIDYDSKNRAIIVVNYHIQRCPNKL